MLDHGLLERRLASGDDTRVRKVRAAGLGPVIGAASTTATLTVTATLTSSEDLHPFHFDCMPV
jgi:hypothetical protein